jgi:hypothetical protein
MLSPSSNSTMTKRSTGKKRAFANFFYGWDLETNGFFLNFNSSKLHNSQYTKISMHIYYKKLARSLYYRNLIWLFT